MNVSSSIQDKLYISQFHHGIHLMSVAIKGIMDIKRKGKLIEQKEDSRFNSELPVLHMMNVYL